MRDGMESWLMLGLGVMVRLAIGFHPYSGAGKPPMYGDYEAQRHWMEITINLPASDWYTETKSNNLSYWGLDYPPLSAYQSWLYGKAIEHFEPAALALSESHGYENSSSKHLMRLSVLASDIIVLFPALLACRSVFYAKAPMVHRDWALVGSLFQPAILLIDHGHFQYNSISLGLAAGAAAAIAGGRDILGSILFCLAMNHKQMAVYYAPAFFAHLLGKCLAMPTSASMVADIAKLGLAVTATFAVVWAPFLGRTSDLLQVLHRIVPVRRGLYEDYVANFWCTTSLAIKWRSLFSQQALIRLCTVSTVLFAAPVLVKEVLRPTSRGLLICMASSAFAFYLFSYQVHEKSILLPLMPVMLLGPDLPITSRWLPAVAAFSMYPLLKKDGLSLAYTALLMLWTAVAWPGGHVSGAEVSKTGKETDRSKVHAAWEYTLGLLLKVSGGLAAGMHAASCLMQAPAQYPYLFDAMITSLSFLHFLAVAVHLQWEHLRQRETLHLFQPSQG